MIELIPIAVGCFPELLNLTDFTAPEDGSREVVWWEGQPIDHRT